MRESKYQAGLRKRIEERIPGVLVLKNDPNLRQGIPDLAVHKGIKCGFLEVKGSEKEAYQPNQEYYLDLLDQEGFARMICPENEEEVLSALESALAP